MIGAIELDADEVLEFALLIADWLEVKEVPEFLAGLCVVDELDSCFALIADSIADLLDCSLICFWALEEASVAAEDLFAVC